MNEVLNQTVTEQVNSTGIQSSLHNIWNYLSQDLLNRGNELITAPLTNPDMLWMLLPLLATLLLMEFYFGRYKEEDMGWNTAFSNSVVLMFIAIDLFRRVYEPSGKGLMEFITMGSDIKIIIPLWLALVSITLIFIDFFHFLPKKIAYIVSSPAYINMIGLLGIIVVYTTNIPLDWTTVLACVILFILANLVALILYYIIPSYKPTISKIITSEEIEKYEDETKSRRKTIQKI